MSETTTYCNNDPCETEATHFYTTSRGTKFHLCFTCKEAFELGQVNAGIALTDIDDDFEDDEDFPLVEGNPLQIGD